MYYYYKQVINGKIVGVEAKSRKAASPGFVKATKAEYDNFIASLPPPPPPPEPLVFTASPPGMAIGERLNNIETFLEKLYQGEQKTNGGV